MRLARAGCGLMILICGGAFGQSAADLTSFEVASVKPAAPMQPGRIEVRMSGGPGTPDPGQLNYKNVSLKNILMNAYAVKGYQLSGPKWLDSERFDVTAKIPHGATKEQFQAMLQNLLAERFKLALHRETKELPMYSLVVAKGGSKLKESVEESAEAPAGGPGGPGGDGAGRDLPRLKMDSDGMPKMPAGMGKNGMIMMMNNGRMRLMGNHRPTSAIAEVLGNHVGFPVVDATGLKGNYDFTLDFAPDGLNGGMGLPAPPPQHEGAPGGPGGGPSAGAPDVGGPTIFAAVQEQLGLKLEQKKGPVELLVIDRLEKTPTEN